VKLAQVLRRRPRREPNPQKCGSFDMWGSKRPGQGASASLMSAKHESTVRWTASSSGAIPEQLG
jgi:hypothetical protein